MKVPEEIKEILPALKLASKLSFLHGVYDSRFNDWSELFKKHGMSDVYSALSSKVKLDNRPFGAIETQLEDEEIEILAKYNLL